MIQLANDAPALNRRYTILRRLRINAVTSTKVRIMRNLERHHNRGKRNRYIFDASWYLVIMNEKKVPNL